METRSKEKTSHRFVTKVLTGTLLALALSACQGQNSGSGDDSQGKLDSTYNVSLKFHGEASGPSSVTQNKSNEVLLAANAIGSQVVTEMCARRIRLKLWDVEDSPNSSADDSPKSTVTDDNPQSSSDDNGSTHVGPEDSLVVYRGVLRITEKTEAFEQIKMPAGHYRALEFDLEPGCGQSESLRVQNAKGTFSLQEKIRLRFVGNFILAKDSVLNFDSTALNQILSNYDGTTDLASALKNFRGAFISQQ